MSALQNYPRITPFLWFNSNAEEAVDFYRTVFKNSRCLDALLTVDDSRGPKGSMLSISFELDAQKFTSLTAVQCSNSPKQSHLSCVATRSRC
ncbi:MAG: VOC family protein [Verrucomicrobia bacterium]|nr:VOC family protein [Verrucomicrobiota bacterium]